MSRDVGCRVGSDLALLWLWHRPAAGALVRPLAWELPYAVGLALKRQKRKKTKKNLPKVTSLHCSEEIQSLISVAHTLSLLKPFAVEKMTLLSYTEKE